MKTFDEMLNEATTFQVGPYIRSHGKNPKGRGMWAFATDPNADVRDEKFWFFSPGNTTLEDAKKLAKKHFGNVEQIYVMP